MTKGPGAVATNVEGAFLRNVNLSQAQLSGANLSNANFYSTVAVGNQTCLPNQNTGFTQGCATAAGATMNATVFSNAYLFGVDFTHAVAQGVLFDNAFLAGANFFGATLSASSSGADTGFYGAFLQGTNMLGVTLQNGISLDNAFVDFTNNGNIIYLVLSGFHTSFPGWKTPGQPACAQMTYNQPSVPPRTDQHVTCPNGSRNAKGCGPPCPNNSACNWKSPVDLTSLASYSQNSTYTPAPAFGEPLCNADLKWIPIDFSAQPSVTNLAGKGPVARP